MTEPRQVGPDDRIGGCFSDLIEWPERQSRREPEMDEAQAMKAWSDVEIEDRVADVCPACGLHMIRAVSARLAWLKLGGLARCSGCGVCKRPAVIASDP